jgi:hypothetical protein
MSNVSLAFYLPIYHLFTYLYLSIYHLAICLPTYQSIKKTKMCQLDIQHFLFGWLVSF